MKRGVEMILPLAFTPNEAIKTLPVSTPVASLGSNLMAKLAES